MLLTPHDEAVIARLRQKKAELVALEGFGLDTRVTVVGGRFVGRRGRVSRLTTMAGHRYVTFEPLPRERTEKCFLLAIADLKVEAP